MCTVSIVPTTDGCRVVCNRDERRTRPIARPPRQWPSETSCAIYPEDPASGGTWIGVNDSGMVAALLNRTSTAGAGTRPVHSRGRIVPELLGYASLDHAVKAAEMLDDRAFEPFRLVVLQHLTVVVITCDATGISKAIVPVGSPLMFTSSSLGDALAEPPRRALFEELVCASDDWLCGQFRFHRHQWPKSPELSVQMARADALTVSRTTIDVTSKTIAVGYEPLSVQTLTIPDAA